MKVISRLLAVCLLVSCTACTSMGSTQRENVDTGEKHRLRNTLIAVGTAVIVGAIVVNKAESNVKDVIRASGTNK